MLKIFSLRKVIIIVLVLGLVLGVLAWRFGPNLNLGKGNKGQSGPVTLNVWGLWEDQNLFKVVVDGYKRVHPDVVINYQFQTSKNYLSRLETKLTNNEGPDIFMIHSSWLPLMLKSNLVSSAPGQVMTIEEYSRSFYPVAVSSLTRGSKIYALPLEIDGLGMYVNEDLFKVGGVSVPLTWQDFIQTANRLTVKNSQGQIVSGGAGIGTTKNVDHWSDILGLLFLQQPGVNIESPANSLGADVVKFYTDFVNDPNKKVWDDNMDRSTQAFEEGKLAIYFAPSWRAYELRVANPSLKFHIEPVPQLLGNKKVSWANFWVYTVSNRSVNQPAAWDFLKYLTSQEAEKLFYQEAAKVRLFGEPYSRLDLQGELLSDPLVGAFVKQGPDYKTWYLASGTQDNAINDEMIKYFEDAINKVNYQGVTPISALQTASLGVSQILDKYNNLTLASP